MAYRPQYKNSTGNTVDLPLDAETVQGEDVIALLEDKSDVGHKHSAADITSGTLHGAARGRQVFRRLRRSFGAISSLRRPAAAPSRRRWRILRNTGSRMFPRCASPIPPETLNAGFGWRCAQAARRR